MRATSKIALVLSLVACSSSEPTAPSRPPVPPPSESSSGGGDGGVDTTCFDATKEKPTEPKHFLNQCNGAGCFPFDNATRIEGFSPSQPLPPLDGS